MQLSGVLGPVVTTFDAATGDVDREAFAANVAAHLAAGLNGLVVAGSTGEAALLDEAERRLLIETARDGDAEGAPAGGRHGGRSHAHRRAALP